MRGYSCMLEVICHYWRQTFKFLRKLKLVKLWVIQADFEKEEN